MIPLRPQYFIFLAFAVLVTVALWDRPWVLLLIWVTLGALQAVLYGIQLRRDLQFARGRRASRKYRVAVRTVATGYLPISGHGPCLVYFTGRHHRASFRLVSGKNEVEMHVEDDAGQRVEETGLQLVGPKPVVIREQKRVGGSRSTFRVPGPGGELYVPTEGPWSFRIRFVARPRRAGEAMVTLIVRVWGRCTDLQVPDAPVIEEAGAVGFPVGVPTTEATGPGMSSQA
jgi:hypothetical protein